jgi:glycogen debranching enzyme
MVVAPELFDAQHAKEALSMVRSVLCGPYGMRTLDPKDLQYRGDYRNKIDSSDYFTSRGFNYHQVWKTDFFVQLACFVYF